MEKTQREFLLRQQMAAIRKELGEGGDGESADRRVPRPSSPRASCPRPSASAVEREIDRLERTSEQSPEHGWIRTWLDTVIELPWGEQSDDHLDVAEARAVLDADHTGLDDVKDRIVEYLAVRKLRGRAGPGRPAAGAAPGAIVALVGPPGVGKTSLGESVARALGRKFVRVSLGGVRDEAEIRGHRRTYVGAQPGRIVRALKEAGTMNPVFLLDEVDKLGSDWRGDPSSALLEVLDPAQNHTFRDHYLEVDLDLSDVLFIATANVLETIPGPLLDRMEIIRLDGYTEDEKVAIARDHLLARQLERNGLRGRRGDRHRRRPARRRRRLHPRGRRPEPRARARQAAAQGGHPARRAATAERARCVVDADDVRGLPGPARSSSSRPPTAPPCPGVATGLAVTGIGGDVLFIEATSLPGRRAAG